MGRRKRSKRGDDQLRLAPGERLAGALKEHQAGNVAAALAIYEELMQASPDHPTLLHFFGMGQVQLRLFVEGEAKVRRALELDPLYHDAWNTLGNLLRLTGRPQEALEAYQRVTEIQPSSIPAWINLGDLYHHTRNAEGAYRAFEKAVELTRGGSKELGPMRFKVLVGLATLKRMKCDWEESARLYEAALQIDPIDPRCRRDLIGALHRAGHRDRALEMAEEWITRAPNDALARRVYASITDINTPASAAKDEVALLFDNYASIFDEQLASLSYRAPALLQDAVERILGSPRGTLDTCDAGCGTGLCGLWLKGHSRRMTGVDLSQGMLDLARERNLYDELERAELTHWLRGKAACFDLLVCADTLCYFGDLTGFCEAAFGALRPGGLGTFTVEYHEEKVARGYHLQINGRYTHNQDYVQRCLGDAGFTDIGTAFADLRLELAQPVRGLVVTMRRPE